MLVSVQAGPEPPYEAFRYDPLNTFASQNLHTSNTTPAPRIYLCFWNGFPLVTPLLNNMDFATCEMRAAESRLPSVLPKVGSCSGLEAKAQFAFSCLKLACYLHSLSAVFYWVLCGKEGARPWPHQGVSHLCCPGSQNSSERGSLECSRCALVCPCWGSHGQLEQPPRLPVPECFSHHILIMMGTTPTLEPQAPSTAWRTTSTYR